MTNLLILALCYLGFTAFALAKFSHYRDVMGQRPTEVQSDRLQWTGWLLSLLSLGLAVQMQAGYGSLLYLGAAGFSIFLLVLLLNFRPDWVKATAGLMSLLALVALCALFWAR